MFISFEGTEGSGKTTQIKMVYAVLRDAGYDVLLTREPGGTEISDQIRTILLDTQHKAMLEARAELLLFCASRAQLVGEVIRPWLQRGGIVLCDRYADSTLAYQGYGHGLPLKELRQILAFSTGNLQPNRTVYLDILPERGLARRRRGQFLGEDWNRLDAMELAFHERVYDGYQQIMAEEPERFLVVDADQTQAAVTEGLLAALRDVLPRPA